MAKNYASKMSAERRRMMVEDPLLKVIITLAFPMIISQLVNSFYGLADTYFVSQLGTAATAAIGVNDSLTHFNQAVAMGFGAGAASYISRLLGAKRDLEASQIASTVLATCMGFMLLLVVIVYSFMSPIIDLLGATATSKPYSMDYARFIMIGAPFTGGTFVLNQLLRSEGSTRYSMFGTVSGCVVNIALDPLLISVCGLEVAGAAIATSISKMVSFTVLLLPFLRRRSVLEISPKNIHFKWDSMKEVLRMGIPTFLRSSCMSVASTITNNVAGSFGDFALASMSVSNKIMKFLQAIIQGFSHGAQPLVGYCWGAKDYKRVKKAVLTVIGVGMLLALVLGLSVSFFTPVLVSALTSASDPLTIETGSQVMRLQCLVLPLHMVLMISSGLYQALGRALSSAVLGLSRSLITLIPCVLILPALFGINGLIWTRAAADIVAFTFIAAPLLIKLMIDLNKKIAEPVLEADAPV